MSYANVEIAVKAVVDGTCAEINKQMSRHSPQGG
jgi:hypothetical protein